MILILKKKKPKKRLITKLYQNGPLLMKILLLLSLFVISACAMGRRVRLDNFSYDLGKHAKLTINSLKRIDDKIQMELLGISLDAEPVVFKASEVECGAGKIKFSKISIDGDKDDLVILSKTSYTEFYVTCINDTDVSKDHEPYILFKKLYKLEANTLGQVLDSNVKIKFK
jgi:hypothetical protein